MQIPLTNNNNNNNNNNNKLYLQDHTRTTVPLQTYLPKKITKKPVFLEVINEWVQYYFYYLDQEIAWPSQGCALAEPSPGTQLLLSGY